jgi:hypothetical protein
MTPLEFANKVEDLADVLEAVNDSDVEPMNDENSIYATAVLDIVDNLLRSLSASIRDNVANESI